MNSSQFSSFMLQFLTEKDLNAYIENTRDLSSLEFALQLKLEYISNNKQGRISFSMIRILNEAKESNIETVCRTLKYALRVQINDSQSKQLLSEMSTKLYSNTKYVTIEKLRFLNVVLKFCLEKQESALALDVLNETFIVRLLNEESKVVNDYVTVQILPFLFKIYPENSINKIVWELIYAKKMSSMLCGIIDHLLPETDKAWSIVHSEKFWEFVHYCLDCKEFCHEKEGVFLLKRAISSIECRDKFSVNSAIAAWNRNNKARVLESIKAYFTLRDVCREKQLHLIEPAYPLLKIIEVLDTSWVLGLYRTLLSHPHNAVALQAVRNILTSNWASQVIVFKDIVGALLTALNRNQYMVTIYCHMDYFLNAIGTENYLLLLRESFKITWIPIACYQFYRYMLIREAPVKISLDIFENIVRTMKKVPHKYVRDGCLAVAVEFAHLNYFSASQIQFDNCLHVAHILHKEVPKSSYVKHVSSFPKNVKELVVMMFDSYQHPNTRYAEINVKYIDVIVESLEELTKTKKLEEKWLEENILRPHLNRVLDTETLDKLVAILCTYNKFELVFPYLETRIKTSTAIECNVSEILEATFALIEQRPDFSYISEFIISFIQQCVCVLIDESGEFPKMQKLFAFEALITAVVNKQFVYAELKSQIAGVVDFWIPKMRKPYSWRIDDDLYFLACNLYCLYKSRECERFDELTAVEMCILFGHIFNAKNDSVISKLYALLPVVAAKIANSSASIVEHTLDLFCNNLCDLQKTKAFTKSLAYLCAGILSVTFAVDYCKLLEKILLVCKSDEAFYVVARELFNAKCAVPCVTQLLLHGDVLVKEQRLVIFSI